jgi:PAS domain S-box-containing protein
VRPGKKHVQADPPAPARRPVLAGSSSVGIAAIDGEGRILDCNRALEEMLGHTAEDLGRRKLADIAHPDDGAARLLGARPGHARELEGRYLRKDGRWFWGRAIVSIGRKAPAAHARGTLVLENVTDRRRDEQRLSAQHAVARILAESRALDDASPQLLKAICESLHYDLGSLWIVDRPRNRLRFVDSWRAPGIEAPDFFEVSRHLDVSPGVGLPGHAWQLARPVWVEDVRSGAPFVVRGPVAAKEGLHGAFAFPIVLGGEVLGVMEFFSREVRQLDAVLLQMLTTFGNQIGQFIGRTRVEEDLRRLATELGAAEDGERRRLARDIHDSIGQTLSALKLELSRVASALGGGGRHGGALDPSLERVDELIAQTRSMTFDLYPPMLDDLGLLPTAQIYAERWGARCGVEITVTETGTPEAVPAAVTNYLFRAIKELLNNAAKHARATRVLVALHFRRGRLRIVVADDGRGFDAVAALAPERRLGLGLADMRERVTSLGGQMAISTGKGRGTEVVLEIPMPGRGEGVTPRITPPR